MMAVRTETVVVVGTAVAAAVRTETVVEGGDGGEAVVVMRKTTAMTAAVHRALLSMVEASAQDAHHLISSSRPLQSGPVRVDVLVLG